MRFLGFLLLALILSLPAAAQLVSPPAEGQIPPRPAIAEAPPRQMIARDIAVLQVLDKVSARTTRLRIPVNSSAAFGLIFITVRSCQIAPPSEMPESAAFLEISEVDINRTAGRVQSGTQSPERLLFSGWMFASSPALSALEHPTYDVTVTGCEVRTATVAERAADGEEGAPVQTGPASGAAAANGVNGIDPAPVD